MKKESTQLSTFKDQAVNKTFHLPYTYIYLCIIPLLFKINYYFFIQSDKSYKEILTKFQLFFLNGFQQPLQFCFEICEYEIQCSIGSIFAAWNVKGRKPTTTPLWNMYFSMSNSMYNMLVARKPKLLFFLASSHYY